MCVGGVGEEVPSEEVSLQQIPEVTEGCSALTDFEEEQHAEQYGLRLVCRNGDDRQQSLEEHNG